MNVVQAILLGILQGLTEWLPISSSGHLALAQGRMGEVPLLFNIMLHVGTTVVLVIYLRHEIARVVSEALGTFRDMRSGEPFGKAWRKNPVRKMAWLVMVATLPTMLLGLLVDRYLLAHFYTSPQLLGGAFIITGVFLMASHNTAGGRDARKGRVRDRPKALNVRSALWIGVSHSFALLPGISRSGSTISTGLILGMDVRTAGRFSFLLAIPAVIGAMILHVGEAATVVSDISAAAIVAGTAASIVVGYLSLDALFMLLHKGRLYIFAPYCLTLGVLVMVIM